MVAVVHCLCTSAACSECAVATEGRYNTGRAVCGAIRSGRCMPPAVRRARGDKCKYPLEQLSLLASLRRWQRLGGLQVAVGVLIVAARWLLVGLRRCADVPEPHARLRHLLPPPV